VRALSLLVPLELDDEPVPPLPLEPLPLAPDPEPLLRAALGGGLRDLARVGDRVAHLGPVAGEQLCQQHCPVSHVAAEFPQLCEAETEVFSQLLGTHVQRLATIAHGDGVCTTFIPEAGRADEADGRTTDITASTSKAGRNPA